MTIFCISDLHLCDKGPRDNFIVRGEKRLYNFLDYVQNQNGRLYILGDLFEWWQCNLSTSVIAYRELLTRLFDMDAYWIVGNHDNACTAFLDVPGYKHYCLPEAPLPRPAFTMEVAGKRFALCHGHEADSTCRDLNPGVGNITAIISGLLEDRNKGPNQNGTVIEDRFIGTLESVLSIWRWLSDQHNRRDELLDGVEAYRKEKRADVIICGHTHEVGRIRNQHYNCGCWCRDKDTFVRIEDDGSIFLFEWDGAKAIPFDKVLRRSQ